MFRGGRACSVNLLHNLHVFVFSSKTVEFVVSVSVLCLIDPLNFMFFFRCKFVFTMVYNETNGHRPKTCCWKRKRLERSLEIVRLTRPLACFLFLILTCESTPSTDGPDTLSYLAAARPVCKSVSHTCALTPVVVRSTH